ncbi:nuclear transport factor 2 family protein [Streptomyces sp. NPDC048172]|uniref:nuclear transport factor 2 family protein n=1 Tax=Streptomyces sp. NPDC048172 TaxID=3365505 RepID=UPI00371466D4
MTDAATPEQVFREGMSLLKRNDFDGWVELFADDAVMEFPYAPEGAPGRVEGREAIAAYMRPFPDHMEVRELTSLVIHTTGDPRTAVVEFSSAGRAVATDEPFAMSYVVFLTVDENGRIANYRDYWNPLDAPASMRAAWEDARA